MSEIIGAITYLLVVVMGFSVGRGDRSTAVWCAFVLCTILAMSYDLLGQRVSDLEATVKELQQTCECSDE